MIREEVPGAVFIRTPNDVHGVDARRQSVAAKRARKFLTFTAAEGYTLLM